MGSWVSTRRLSKQQVSCPDTCYSWRRAENVLSERSQTQSHTFYDSIYTKGSEQANPQRQKDEWLPGAGEVGGLEADG